MFDMKLKTRRHHADDGELLGVERNRLPHNIGLSAETSLPKTVTQYGDVLFAWFIVFGQERAAENRFDSEYFEKLGRGECHRQFFGLADAGEIHALIGKRRHLFEARALRFPLAIVLPRGRVLMASFR